MIVNNVPAMKKCMNHRGLDQVLREIEELEWDLFPCNEAIRVALLLGFDDSYDIDNCVTR